MADLGGLSFKDFMGAVGIGKEIEQTTIFLSKLFVKFLNMIHLIYKTLKKYLIKYIFQIWPIYLSCFIVAMVITLFSDKSKRKRNMMFLVYLGLLYVVFLIFLTVIRIFETVVKTIIFLVERIKSAHNFAKKKKHFKAFIEAFICILVIIWIFILIAIICILCVIIKYFSYGVSAIFDFIESMDNF